MVSGEMPENPLAKTLIRRIINIRVLAKDNGGPVPAECDVIKFTCNSHSFSEGMLTFAKLPNPVLIP
jgi:hypothetical protein